MKIRIIECFSGIGACSKALKNLGYDVEIVDAIDNDKFAMKSFNAIHDTNFEVQDIAKWNKRFDNIDLVCGGFCCQDISIAGKQAGIIKGVTRSGLMYELMRIISEISPHYVLIENVKNLLSKKHIDKLKELLIFLSDKGYKVSMDVLNASDYNVPQNRPRVFIVGERDE